MGKWVRKGKTTPVRTKMCLSNVRPMMRLRGRFLLWFPKAKRAHSFLSMRNSREVMSSKGRMSFLRLSILALGLRSFVWGCGNGWVGG